MKPARSRLLLRYLSAALASCLTASAFAADWQVVLSDAGRKIEIDRASIFNSDHGTKVSWGRVVLGDEEAGKAGYRTVKALNRYDCRNSSFFTIKRVYLDTAERVLREESVADQTPVVVAKNSVDERMWREVCKPPGLADLAKIADSASESAAAAVAGNKAVPMMPAPAPQSAKTPAAPPKVEPPPKKPAPTAHEPKSEAAPPATKPTPAEALIKEREAAAASRLPTPAAMPIPSIRPNLAGLVEKNMADPAKGEIAHPPPKASAETAMAEQAKAAEKAAPATEPAQAAKAAPRPRPAATTRATTSRERSRARSTPPAARAKAPAAQKPVAQMTDEGWSYGGDTGPDRWGSLRPEWKLCSDGKRQSPINLQNGVAVDLEPVKFDYRPTRFRITDTGKMLRVNVDVGMSVEVRGKRYELEYVTLHRPSQERVGGGASDMVVHFHHRSADGELANVGVLMERGEQDNPMLQVLLNNLPLEKGSTYMPDLTIDLAAFMPTRPEHYLYLGSLTTPPCTEGVLWVVMKQSGELSQNQLDIFNRLYPRNSRPIQPTNGRLVLESR